MIGSIFQAIGQVITQFANSIASVFQSIAGMFFDSTDNELTLLGTLLIIAAGVGIVYWGFRIIYNLVRGAGR